MTDTLFSAATRAATGEVVEAGEFHRLLLKAAKSKNQAAALGIDQANRMRVRDDALVDAARLLNHDDSNQWAVAKRLSQAIRRFESRVWPALQEGQIFDDLEPIDRVLHRAFMSGARIPKTARRLYDLF